VSPRPQGDRVYEYVDERLEALSGPKKHLLRLGPASGPRAGRFGSWRTALMKVPSVKP
jgi:hypothetical protein